MNNPIPPSPTQGDGVFVTKKPSTYARYALLYKLLAFALVAACAAYLFTNALSPPPDWQPEFSKSTYAANMSKQRPQTGVNALASVSKTTQTTNHQPQIMSDDEASTYDPDDISNYISPEEPPPHMEKVIKTLNDAGIRSGLGAFPPPGTSPPLIGLVVPENAQLPEGYVRHYQTTDDGQDIEAILMYSPDYQFFDEQGNPIPVPENRVVPPEHAPADLLTRPVTIPPPRDSDI